MKKPNPKSKTKSVAFQSDIIIDPDGNIHISFLGADLLHLIDHNQEQVISNNKWTLPLKLPAIDFSEYQNCKVCPKSCGFNRQENMHPLCGDDKLRVSNYGVSFGDESIISGGGGSGIIFLSGCPLTCPSCINKEKVHSQGQETTPEEFYTMLEKLHQKNVSNIQILSPTVHFPILRQILRPLKASGFPIPIAFKTSGYDSPKQIERFEGLVDIYIPDLKPCFNLAWAKRAKVGNTYVSLFEETIKKMYQQVGRPQYNSQGSLIKGILIRYVRPDFLTSSQEHQIMSFLETLQDYAHISVLDTYVNLEK